MTKFKAVAGGVCAAMRPVRGAFVGLTLALAAVAQSPAGAAEPPLTGVFKDNFTLLSTPLPVPETALVTDSGARVSLHDFRGRVVLLNFWATWCAPCVREMPSLDRVQAMLGEDGLSVVAVSEDFAGLAVVEPFYERLGLAHLGIYLDVDGALSKALKIQGLPTTLLIDRQGGLVGGLEGPAEWDSQEAVSLIRHYLSHPAPTQETHNEPAG